MAPAGVREIELAGLKAWPGIETERDGAWMRRAAGGYTKRANSVQCLDPADAVDAPRRIAESRRWFEARHLPPVFRITPLAGPRLRDALDEAGWRPMDPSRTLGMELRASNIETDTRVEMLPADDAQWLAAQGELQGYDGPTIDRLKALVSAIEVPCRGLLLRSRDGQPLASAIVDVADGIVFAGNVVTAVDERGKGYGSAVMRAGLAWAVSEGANFAAINVLADNAAGLALYRSLGYVHAFDYHYRMPPA